MDEISPFVTHFSRLVWLLATRSDDQNGHKEVLRRALMQLSAKPQVVVLRDISLAVASAPDVTDENVGSLRDLAFRMAGHSVRQLHFEAAVPAREVMEIAKILASAPMHGDEGAAFDDKLLQLYLTGVTAHLGGSGFVRTATPMAMPAFEGGLRTRTPSAGMQSQPPGIEEPPGPRHPAPAAESQAMMQVQLMPALSREASIDDILSRLDQAVSSPSVRDMVDDVARVTEDLAARGRWADSVKVMERMHQIHDRQHEGDVKRAFLMGIRRLQRPAILQGVALLLPADRELRDSCVSVLRHSGDLGADVLIDKLIGSEVSGERRLYIEALRQCPAAVRSLVHLLDDDRWYVVRNAASLIGELRAVEADRGLAELLSHRESRVRQAAAGALGKLATPRALLALLQCLHDPSPEVRLQSVWAVAASRNPRTVPWIIEALDSEHDGDVQAALISALGAAPTDDGVARLVQAAEAGGLMVRKPAALRLRAIEALGEAGTPAACQALQRLVADRDREVRAAVEQAVGKLSA